MDKGHSHAASHETFAACLKQIRIRIHAKQVWLAREIGRSDAAISQWENGMRLPSQESMRRTFQALERYGALPGELLALLVAWRSDRGRERIAAAVPTEVAGPDR
jgi:transcriptional regulator with XRE-family HTH domain